jgi:formylglycine-generating enzyme required for sulfatase activity
MMEEKKIPAQKETPPGLPLSGEEQRGVPYPGLRPYTDKEQGKFFGREADKAILVDKVLGSRLTLLFAASGVGKSSLLQAAVIPHLQSAEGENLTVVCNTDWVSEPLARLRDRIEAAGLLPAGTRLEGETLTEWLEFCGLFVHRPPLVLILDQFEEFFRYQRHSAAFRPFIEQLAAVITEGRLPVSVVISMREDFAMELNAFKPQLPTLLFENFYRLEKLNKKAATQAILDPVRQLGCDYEPELLQRLLDDLKDHKREQGELPHQTPALGLETVDPPYLQIVCAYLWRLKGENETVLRLASYEKAGGIDGILNYFLDHALARLSSGEKQLASRAFDYLAAQRGLKMAYPLDVLARILKVAQAKLGKVLAKLATGDMRILRDQEREEVVWYELYHDMFSDSIDKWNNRWKAQRLKRQRLVTRTVIGILLIVLAVLGDSLRWLSQNSIFPAQYLLKEQEFRLMDWGLLPEPLPEMVEIHASQGEFQAGELDKTFGETANQSLQAGKTYDLQNFGYPPITASIPTPFSIGKYEITYEQYDYYVWQQRRAGKNEDEVPYPTGAIRDNARGQRAVTQVSWDEASAYTQWLSTKTGQEFRLPTEVEWEYAARAKDKDKDKTAYPWGDEAGKNNANCNGCGSKWDNKFIAPVGSFAANSWGLYDSSGNVWEWTCSEWQPELGDAAKQCAGNDASVRRVIRGGSWNYYTVWVRSSARYGSDTVNRNDNVGFRVLRLPRQDN